MYRRPADVTDQVLRGAKPGDIPYYQQTKFELLLNRKRQDRSGWNFLRHYR
jgi:putative ABC transport system substrate-binding protein